MEEHKYLIASLERASRHLRESASVLGCLDKQEVLESFEVGYEQAWMEVAQLLIAMQVGRLQKYVKIEPKESKFGLPREND